MHVQVAWVRLICVLRGAEESELIKFSVRDHSNATLPSKYLVFDPCIRKWVVFNVLDRLVGNKFLNPLLNQSQLFLLAPDLKQLI